jgi:hypothetical protein
LHAEKLKSALIKRVRNNALLITHTPAQAHMPVHANTCKLAHTQIVNQSFSATTLVQ